jgi:hypothetical protein
MIGRHQVNTLPAIIAFVGLESGDAVAGRGGDIEGFVVKECG